MIGEITVPIPNKSPINAPVSADFEVAAKANKASRGGHGPRPYTMPAKRDMKGPVILNLDLRIHLPCILNKTAIPNKMKKIPKTLLGKKNPSSCPKRPTRKPRNT